METLKYTVINTISQYNDYCTQLELLVEKNGNNQNVEDEIALLTLLIEK